MCAVSAEGFVCELYPDLSQQPELLLSVLHLLLGDGDQSFCEFGVVLLLPGFLLLTETSAQQLYETLLTALLLFLLSRSTNIGFVYVGLIEVELLSVVASDCFEVELLSLLLFLVVLLQSALVDLVPVVVEVLG